MTRRLGGAVVRPRVLLVTHETSRTGAPRVALGVARTLLKMGYDLRVQARTAGPMLDDFRSVARTELEPVVSPRGRLRLARGLRWVGFLADTLVALAALLRHRPDLLYLNSTGASIYLRPARWLGLRTVLHVHESRDIAAALLRVARERGVRQHVGLIACSPSVRRELAELTGRPLELITLLPSVPDDEHVAALALRPPDRAYPMEEVIVGCCGAVEHRKGYDLWLAVAHDVLKRVTKTRVRFVWVGEISVDVEDPGDPRIQFLGPAANPYAHMRRFDIATLTSRDDPFPLVVLEAMSVGTPVVAFAVGGVPDQIGDAGILVPAGDVASFSDAVVALVKDPTERMRLGQRARARVEEKYSTAAFEATLASVLGSLAPKA